MTNATTTQGGNPSNPIFPFRVENQKAHSFSTGLARSNKGFFGFRQNQILDIRRKRTSTQAETPINVQVAPSDSIELRMPIENAASESAPDSFDWQTLNSGRAAWLFSPFSEGRPLPLTPNPVLIGLVDRLDEFRVMQNGWLDGYGSAPNPQGLDWLQQRLVGDFEDAPIPHIYPTPEGDVQFEWDIGFFRPSLEIDLETHVGEWHCLDLEADESYERELQLGHAQDWKWLTEELHCLQGKSR